ncbi:MAG: transcriptional regulator of a riboflavin/FAD biosynthetic operon [Haloquadratum walsbyi J07HQW1]|uniref:Riboflavin kinase n=1 Tax=Haloquadratum walsbyi J07HQW1 TaxID=1238424 RepID=U1PHP2_9EURY|nr:MAG: transcriptional regulator of a riboflavin/FAD biosynthetic operon [Haloquadratum walsbyi J07HQW1]
MSVILNMHRRLTVSMAESTTAVGHNELAALKFVALEGARSEPIKISCSGLSDRLDASSQTASRRLQRLETAGYLDRDVVTDGQWVSLTEKGEIALHKEYTQYQEIFEDSSSVVELTGTVTSGMGEGRHYISLSGYMEQFRERLGYEPFPGTLNIDLDDDSTRTRAAVSSLTGIRIDGWEDEERTFGPATCYPAEIILTAQTAETAHIIVPERTHHDETQLEVIAPERLRDSLDLTDGQRLTVQLKPSE